MPFTATALPTIYERVLITNHDGPDIPGLVVGYGHDIDRGTTVVIVHLDKPVYTEGRGSCIHDMVVHPDNVVSAKDRA